MAKKTTGKRSGKNTGGRRTRSARPASRRATGSGTKKKTKKKTSKKSVKKVAKKPGRKKTTTKKTAKKKPATRKTVTKKAPARPRKAATTGTVSKKTAGKKTTVSAGKPPARGPKTTTANRSTEVKVSADAASKSAPKKKRRSPRALGAKSVAEAASAGTADAQGYVYVNGRRVRMISTKGHGTIRRSKPTAPVAAAVETEPKEIKPIKTKLTAKELRYYRDLLLQKRAELVGDVSAMESAALQDRGGNLSNLPLHMADIGTDTYDQDFMLSLAETERQRLHEIDDALQRIKDKTYGVCQLTGHPIPAARLKAKPWAKYTIESARKMEGQWRA